MIGRAKKSRRKKEVLNFEIEFIKQQTNNNDMTLNSLVELYFNDLSARLKLNTLNTKRVIFDTKILTFFKDMPLSDIKPTNIRAWQNEILNQGYTETYIKSINNQLVALFNYSIKYYGLNKGQPLS